MVACDPFIGAYEFTRLKGLAVDLYSIAVNIEGQYFVVVFIAFSPSLNIFSDESMGEEFSIGGFDIF